MAKKERLRWGILGTGAIAKKLALAVRESETGTLTAVGSRTEQSARKFVEEFPEIDHVHASYADLINDEGIDVVYIATPHPWHAEWAIRAAQAGKHILCEKPLAMNEREAKEVISAAEKAGVFLMEGFMWRCTPLCESILGAIRNEELGRIGMIEATFSFDAGSDTTNRLLSKGLGGGGILDVGCYPVSFVRLIAGAAEGKPFAEPRTLSALGRIGSTGVDESAHALLQFESGVEARISCGLKLWQENRAVIHGSKASLTIPLPWNPRKFGGPARYLITPSGAQDSEVREIEMLKNGYIYEVDRVWRDAASLQAEAPAMGWADSLGNMRLLDRWRDAIGLSYPADQ